jgi:hypothetical protein
MRIAELAFTPSSEADEVSALVGDFRLSYRVTPGVVSAASAGAFLAAALLPAMARGEPLELDPPHSACPRLLAGLDKLQEIFSVWIPQLHRVPVRACAAPPPSPRPLRGSFFSGGVDSLYTFLENQDELTHAIQIHGYDYGRDDRALSGEAERRNRLFVEGRGRRLVVVESNHREFYARHRIHFRVFHGSLLASIGLALGFERVFIPASFTWTTLGPWGSHPLTDPLWSSQAVEVVHDGIAVARPAKLLRVGRDPAALDLLRVCFDAYNCQVCEKCLRTRFALRALGLRSSTLEPLDSTWRVCLLRPDADRYFDWVENYALAVEKGDRALARAAALCLTWADVHGMLVKLDKRFLGARGRGTLRGMRRVFSRRPAGPSLLQFDSAS